MSSAQRVAAAVLLLAGATSFALELRYVWPFTADDAFITFRYARNWVAGFGPNFNVDGTRSEGVTSFGYLLISCLPQALGIDPVRFGKALGVAVALGSAWLVGGLARALSGESAERRETEGDALVAAAFAAALFLAFHATAIHAASGMETLLAPSALFLAIATVLSLRALEAVWLAIGAVMALALLPDPVMNFDFRYCMPAAGGVAAVAGVGFARLCRLAAGSQPQQARAVTIVFTVATIVFLAAGSLEPARSALRERRAYGQALESTYVRLGRVLADYRPESGHPPVLAIGDAGAIPYYSGWRVIDTFSLNDPAIAIDGRHEPGYVLDQAPDLVGVVSEQGREFSAHWANRHDGPLFSAALAHGMQPAVILTFSARSYLYLMARPGSEIARYLRSVYLEHSP